MKKILGYVPSIIIPMISSLIVTVIYGKWLEPSQYGNFNIFTNNLNLINLIIFSFITMSTIRLHNKYKNLNKEKIYISTIFIFIIFISLVFIILAIIIRNQEFTYLILSLISVVFFTFYTNMMRSNEEIIKFNFCKCFISISLVIMILIALSDSLTYYNIILATYFPQFIIVIIISIIFISKGKIKFVYEKNILVECISYGFPLVVVGLLNLILSSLDRYMLKYFLDSNSVGLYSFGYKISQLSMMNITSILAMSFYPEIIKKYEQYGIEKSQKVMDKYLNLNFIITIPIIFLFQIFMKDIVFIFFPKYIGAESIINSVTLGTFFYTITIYTNKAFELTKNIKRMIYTLIISAMINIILNLLLIPIFDVNGASIATIVSYIIYVILNKIFSKKVFNIKFYYKNILLIIFINAFICAVIMILKKVVGLNGIIWLFGGGSIYMVLYTLIIYINKKRLFL